MLFPVKLLIWASFVPKDFPFSTSPYVRERGQDGILIEVLQRYRTGIWFDLKEDDDVLLFWPGLFGRSITSET
jgi:hypothetical protein